MHKGRVYKKIWQLTGNGSSSSPQIKEGGVELRPGELWRSWLTHVISSTTYWRLRSSLFRYSEDGPRELYFGIQYILQTDGGLMGRPLRHMSSTVDRSWRLVRRNKWNRVCSIYFGVGCRLMLILPLEFTLGGSSREGSKDWVLTKFDDSWPHWTIHRYHSPFPSNRLFSYLGVVRQNVLWKDRRSERGGVRRDEVDGMG